MLREAQLLKKQKEIDEKIGRLFPDPTYDGIIDPGKYVNAPVKILWIMKEVPDIGGYNQREALNNNCLISNRGNWWRTIDPVIYISYSLLNGFQNVDIKKKIKDYPEMIEVLKQVAFINIKKEPGESVSYNNVLEEYYNKTNQIIKEQIELANPDIIIGGNTLHLLWEELGVAENQIKSCEEFDLAYAVQSERILFNSYHPSYLMTKKNREYRTAYFNSIVDQVKKWRKINK